MNDLPAILDAITHDRESEALWRAYAPWLSDNGRDDEAAAIHAFWPAIADTIAMGTPLAEVMEQVRANAARLGRIAWEVEKVGAMGE